MIFANIANWFVGKKKLSTTEQPAIKVTKRIAFIDADQALPGLTEAFDRYLRHPDVEVHAVIQASKQKAARKFRKDETFPKATKHYLEGFTAGKEISDKFIGAYIQRAITEGYTHITVVSSDFDFIDIFRMAVMIDPKAANVEFRQIVPNPQGRLNNFPKRSANIEVIRLDLATDARKEKIAAKQAVTQVKVEQPEIFGPQQESKKARLARLIAERQAAYAAEHAAVVVEAAPTTVNVSELVDELLATKALDVPVEELL